MPVQVNLNLSRVSWPCMQTWPMAKTGSYTSNTSMHILGGGSGVVPRRSLLKSHTPSLDDIMSQHQHRERNPVEILQFFLKP